MELFSLKNLYIACALKGRLICPENPPTKCCARHGTQSCPLITDESTARTLLHAHSDFNPTHAAMLSSSLIKPTRDQG